MVWCTDQCVKDKGLLTVAPDLLQTLDKGVGHKYTHEGQPVAHDKHVLSTHIVGYNSVFTKACGR